MDSIYNTHKPSTGGGDYLKLKDGDKVKLRIASEPAISVYKAGDRFRYNWIIWNREDKKAQIYSAGVSVFKQIAALTEDWGLPTEFDIRISRSGSGMNDTEYIVTPVKTSDDLTKDELEKVASIDLTKAIKGKWLAEYEDDGELPDPVVDTTDMLTATPTEAGEIDLNDVPF